MLVKKALNIAYETTNNYCAFVTLEKKIELN